MIRANVEKERLLRTLEFVRSHRLNFLSMSMATAKAMTDFCVGCGVQHDRHGDGAQRRGLWYPRQRPGR
jgi:hypothetical protein